MSHCAIPTFFFFFLKGDDEYENRVNCDIQAAVMSTRERMHALKCQTSPYVQLNLLFQYFISVLY